MGRGTRVVAWGQGGGGEGWRVATGDRDRDRRGGCHTPCQMCLEHLLGEVAVGLDGLRGVVVGGASCALQRSANRRAQQWPSWHWPRHGRVPLPLVAVHDAAPSPAGGTYSHGPSPAPLWPQLSLSLSLFLLSFCSFLRHGCAPPRPCIPSSRSPPGPTPPPTPQLRAHQGRPADAEAAPANV